MIKHWYIGDKGPFDKTRAGRIGASDIPAILGNPDKPTESLAGYGRTAVTTYLEKRGERERDLPGLPAEMGHYLENKALELFIRRFVNDTTGCDFRRYKEAWENRNPETDLEYAEEYQLPDFKHSTEYFNDDFIAHPDLVYVPPENLTPDDDGVITHTRIHSGIRVERTAPFLVEAKSAQLFAAKRREGSLVSGYDFDLTTWHGIPLKHFVQIQFQLAIFEIKVAYLALIYDTSNFQVWQIEANPEWQGRIIDIAGKMAKCIREGRMPRELAMNRADIMEIYPRPEKDYVMLSGGELDIVTSACVDYRHATQQVKNWEAKKVDAQDALAVRLGEYEEIRGADGKAVVKWVTKKGSPGIKKPKNDDGKDSFLKYISKNDLNCYRYLTKRGYVRTSSEARYVSISYKGE